ncbi:MAG: recombinase [Caulobacteraceae bacterium]|nr:recombinase [Caulobacteraceae bacterium]
MKVAIITDTHYGCRKGSKLFQDYFETFYKNIFFPTLEQHGITTVIHMGDAFDSRKSIDYQSLEWTKRVVLDPLSKYNVHMLVGNHDAYYKNTNNVNSPSLLLQNYSNIKTYSDPEVIKIGNLNTLLIPWICADNEEKTLRLIKKSGCKVAMGHLELNGFEAYRGHTMDDGMDSIVFDGFTKVFSGHYHTRSTNGVVFYLGNPYEMYWNDVNDTRGFHIFDTETLEHTPVNNPYRIYYIIHYEDTNYQTFDTREYENKIVKVIVRKKTNTKKFEKFIDKLYTSNVAELKIVENFQIEENENFEAFESEDTLSVLNRYIEESEINLDKKIIQKMFKEIYQEACELV